jgi:hypothetical protein
MRRLIAWFGLDRPSPRSAVAPDADSQLALDPDEFWRLLRSGKPEDLKKIARAMTRPNQS